MTSTLELSVIGNSTISAFSIKTRELYGAVFPASMGIQRSASAEQWWRRRNGSFNITLFDQVRSEQQYRRNSAIVVTTLFDDNGSAVEITDFAPRFKQFGRVFRPTMLVRHIRPLNGTPRVCIRLRPAFDHGAQRPKERAAQTISVM